MSHDLCPMRSDPALVADQLLAEFDRIRPGLTYAVIVELRQRVEAHKFHDPVRTLAIADTAVMAAAALHEPAAEALAAWAKATALLFNGRAGAALPWYRRAEQRYDELAQPLEQVGVQAPLVYALNAAGDQAAALQLATAVQARCLALGAPARQALAHLEMNLGTICKQQGAFAASLAACDRAKTLFNALDDREGGRTRGAKSRQCAARDGSLCRGGHGLCRGACAPARLTAQPPTGSADRL